MNPNGKRYFVQIRPTIPANLVRLEELAYDLWFSWNTKARALFYTMDSELWELCDHNPLLFLRRINQDRLNEVSKDRSFLAAYNGILSYYDSYKTEDNQWFPTTFDDAQEHSIAYFSAEFGLHESLPIYSGGLGILAGDHCKSASDLGLPFTAVGLLYRNGYFTQTIDGYGKQIATYHDNKFGDLSVAKAKNLQDEDAIISISLPDRELQLQVWEARAGHIRMLLLDADLEQNSTEDRTITSQLYGGDIENRIKQEICLGVGGVRALRATGRAPTVWHANEGHAAFTILERIREYMHNDQLSFAQAKEMTISATVFTTHTPVPAGHDIFPIHLFDHYMGHYANALGLSIDELHNLGKGDFGHGSEGFNQTALAIHGSAYQNGVAKLHGEVSSDICQDMWPDIEPEENPITSVTNGVHVTTWLNQEWINLFDQQFGDQWRSQLLTPDFWNQIHQISDSLFWSIHQTIKLRLLNHVEEILEQQATRNGESLRLTRRMTANFDVRTLVIGFARRFATYKRASLLFEDEAKLLEILDDVGHPILFLFAGKAHPADHPGQALIRRIHEISRKPEFIGRVLMVEGYDMSLGRYLTSGVDVWLNNPRRPMEASGTSGMKAAMNGVPNLSILDGWWPEGFHDDNGWVIGGAHSHENDEIGDADDLASLYDTLRYDVIPTYYQRNDSGFSDAWVHICKQAMIRSIPHFNTDRMVSEYAQRFYVPASRSAQLMAANQFSEAKALAAWKEKVSNGWHKVGLSNEGATLEGTRFQGDSLEIRVKAYLHDLHEDDVRIEVVSYRAAPNATHQRVGVTEMTHTGDHVYSLTLAQEITGNIYYQIRIYPTHKNLAHPFSMGLLKWLHD
ncbi:MAG: alpha-glucan family phosphorylase [Mariprofundaceae bacterium]|nr:alpha-glucan family phosphorylase [Mariprofundaceae bacterium]